MRRIIYNEDSQGVTEARPEHAREDLEKWVDKPFSRIPIDTYAWCIATPFVCMHNSRVAEIHGARFTQPPDTSAEVIRALQSAGTDVLDVVAKRTHEHGAEIVASVRMNDTHGLYPAQDNPGMSTFLIEHPEWTIQRLDGIPERAMDYSVPEVRNHVFAVLQELAENYEIDGLELDFTRWAKFFPRHEAPFKIPIMNAFVRDVRAMLDRVAEQRGRKRFVLGAQVQESLYLCHLSGVDPQTWVQHDQVDYLIQSDFNCTNPQIPTHEFAAFCSGSGCTHHVRMGNMMAAAWSGKPHMAGRTTGPFKNNPSYGGMVLMPDEARGAAANAYGFGADGIGLWNICCNMGTRHKPDKTGPDRAKFQEDMFQWIAEIVTPEKVWSAPRRYHFVPIYKKADLPIRNYPEVALQRGPTGSWVQIVTFPQNSLNHRQPYYFLTADGKNGETLNGSLRVRFLGATEKDIFRLDLNGKTIPDGMITIRPEPDDELPALWYEVDLSGCPPLCGQNELGMTLTRFDTDRALKAPPYMEELEVIVR